METHATSKGQIQIPAALRRKYGIKKGTRIAIIDDGAQIILQPVTADYIRSQFGAFHVPGLMKEFLANKQQEREREDRELEK
ncbi:MAG TPA: AbrB/MazE/SpoVT family DNA-binding domain-containing protein [Planctomycetota bacterium]|jgi:AbrB family looped-hinge helix DNA binding protein|nr:AbrB/MazE/SpoVT family DNA-binding domain-containing protein [Planctomycetota bacterium]